MNWLVPAPVALPLLVAAVLVALAPICRRPLADCVGIATAALVTIACVLLLAQATQGTIVYWFGDWAPRGHAAIGISFVIDPLGAAMASLCAMLVTLTLIFSWRYFEAVRTYYHVLMLVFLAAMTGFSLTGDLFNLFVFFELMSVTAYALTGYKVEEANALEGSINFAVTNSVGEFLVLLGIGLVYGRTGALNLAQAGVALASRPVDMLVLVALTLILCGFLVKAAVVPFHFWLADAHAVAPTPVCVLFSGVMIELGLYGAFRVYHTVFAGALAHDAANVRLVFMGLGGGTAVLGAIMCYTQRHLKRLLAFSSISHIGVMLVGLGTLEPRGTAGAGLYVLTHAFVKGALFMCAGLFLHRFGTVDEMELRGRGGRRPILASAMILGGLGLAGFPPFGTYLGKQLIEEAGARVQQHWLSWIFLAASILTGGAVLRFALRVFFGGGSAETVQSHSGTAQREKRETHGKARKVPVVMLTMAAILVLIPAVSGFFNHDLAIATEAGSERFNDRELYTHAVMESRPTGPAHAIERVHLTTKGLVLGTAAALGAVGLALFDCYWNRILVSRVWWRPVQQAVGWLQQLQSGRVNDYVTWLVIGVVLVGVGLILAAR